MANNSKEYNKKNYKKYWGKPSQIKDRTARNKARNEAEKAGKVSKGDGKEVDHKKPLAKGGSRSTKNTRVVSRKTNRKAGAAIANKRKGSGYKIKKTTKKK